MKAKEISVIGRNTQGVRLIALESADEKVTGISKLPESQEEPEENGGEVPAVTAPLETAEPMAEATEESKPSEPEPEAS
jgi:DNA gyrase subunit A